ncbi:MAG TPA: molybdenum cofactor biosynthesis protein B [Candidatus Binataceae bacterium]|nr:molybdenum cofactor biosynthesis protein B [Candidatus Binataceae bacterium]
MSEHQHHHHSQRPGRRNLRAAVVVASDSRTARDDVSGKLIAELLATAGVEVASYQVLPDEPAQIAQAVRGARAELDLVIISGGTGIGARDNSYEALTGLLDKELTGFGELFRMLSYQEIGAAAFLSRATAGISAGKLVVCLPGAPAAGRLGVEKLLLPALDHIAELLELG